MKLTILLADAANISANGNLDALGLGWDIAGPSPLPGFCVVMVAKVPLDWPDGQMFELSLRLQDSSGEAVKQAGNPSAEIGVQLKGQVPPMSERPSGLPGGLTGIATLPPGLILDPGIYEWVASVKIAGAEAQEWRRPFYVRSNVDEFPAKPRMIPTE